MNFQGLPSMDEIINLDELISFCTTIIFNCTAQHSAVNDSQYDIFGYLPNMPLQLLGNPPTNKVLIISLVLFYFFAFFVSFNKFSIFISEFGHLAGPCNGKGSDATLA